jgi:hypothetical protein
MDPESPVIEIPQRGDVLSDCARRLLVFCATDPSYFGYDSAGQDHLPTAPDVITSSQLRATNAAMRAFAFTTDWRSQGLLDTPLPELSPAALPLEADLIEMPDDEWELIRLQVEAAYRRLTSVRAGTRSRIKAVAASKVLHLKRPRLFAIVDSRILRYWNLGQADPVHAALGVADAVRTAGRHGGNQRALQECAAYLASHPLDGVCVHMSSVRMLDALVWMKMTESYCRLWDALGWSRL